jgi:hypothetical protein
MSHNHTGLRNLGSSDGVFISPFPPPFLPLHHPLSDNRAAEMIRGNRLIGSWKNRDFREL